MNQLFITQRNQQGREKVFRFNTDRDRFLIGASRKADIRLPKSEAEKMEGCLEFENGTWVYHSFSMRENAPLLVPLIQGSFFQIGDHRFTTEVVEQKSLFDDQRTEGALGEQIVMIFFQGRIFHTERIHPGNTLRLELAGEHLEIETMETREWRTSQQGSFEIRQKTLVQEDRSGYLKTWKDALDLSREDRFVLGGLFATFLLGLFSLLFTPREAPEIALNEPPKSSAPMVMKLVPPTERKMAAPAESNKQNKGPVNRMNRIQDLSQSIASRAGRFLKKNSLSASAIGPNGSMNAPALGVSRLDGPSTDWNAVAGEQVAGKVGGQLGGAGGTGTRLSGESVGKSGVNLLDQESEVAGGLDREVIAEFIRRHIGHILYCYERSLSANPNLFGKVSVRFVIGASGKVETQKIGESTLKDNRVEGCILDKVSQWQFPTPKGGMQVSVTYPFMFKTTN